LRRGSSFPSATDRGCGPDCTPECSAATFVSSQDRATDGWRPAARSAPRSAISSMSSSGTVRCRRGNRAKQVQRWLGHHSAAFTLATYAHLGDGDIAKSSPSRPAPRSRRRQPSLPRGCTRSGPFPTPLGAVRAESLDGDSALRSPFAVSAPLRSAVQAV
jgi:hypothetical protein